jgi:hypothetical protein
LPKVRNGVQIEETLFSIIAPILLDEVLGELQSPTAIYTDGSKTQGLVGFGILLNDRDSYRFRFPVVFSLLKCFSCDLIESKPICDR